MFFHVVLGGSNWKHIGDESHSEAMQLTYSGYLNYLEKFAHHHPGTEILDLFNFEGSIENLDAKLREFLSKTATDDGYLVITYVGHGHVSDTGDFFLCTPNSDPQRIDISGYPTNSLSDTLIAAAPKMPTLVVLDCCWSATAFASFQTQSDGQLSINPMLTSSFRAPASLRSAGIALLCAGPSNRPALAPKNGSKRPTVFGGAFLQVLNNGIEIDEGWLTAKNMQIAIGDLIRSDWKKSAPEPEVHYPRGQSLGIPEVPFFPNNLNVLNQPMRGGVTAYDWDRAQGRISELESTLQSLFSEKEQADHGIVVKKGFFAPQFLNRVISETSKNLDISICRARVLNFDTLTEIRALCRSGVEVRCCTLSADAHLAVLSDALNNIVQSRPKSGQAYRTELKNLTESFINDIDMWDTSEQEKIGFFISRDHPRLSLVRSDDTVYFGLLTFNWETHRKFEERPYFAIQIASEMGQVIMNQFAVQLSSGTTKRISGKLRLNK